MSVQQMDRTRHRLGWLLTVTTSTQDGGKICRVWNRISRRRAQQRGGNTTQRTFFWGKVLVSISLQWQLSTPPGCANCQQFINAGQHPRNANVPSLNLIEGSEIYKQFNGASTSEYQKSPLLLSGWQILHHSLTAIRSGWLPLPRNHGKARGISQDLLPDCALRSSHQHRGHPHTCVLRTKAMLIADYRRVPRLIWEHRRKLSNQSAKDAVVHLGQTLDCILKVIAVRKPQITNQIQHHHWTARTWFPMNNLEVVNSCNYN